MQAFWTRRHYYAQRRRAQHWPKRLLVSLLILTLILVGVYAWRVATGGDGRGHGERRYWDRRSTDGQALPAGF